MCPFNILNSHVLSDNWPSNKKPMNELLKNVSNELNNDDLKT